MTDEAVERLLAEGSPFALEPADVAGRKLPNYRRRLRDMSAVMDRARKWPERTFVVWGEERISYDRFVATVGSLRAGLTRLGLAPQQRVAVFAQNSPGWCATFWGAVTSGAVFVGLNGWWSAAEVNFALADSGTEILVADRRRLERLPDVFAESPRLRHIVVLDAEPDECGFGGDERVHSFASLVAGEPVAAAPVHDENDAVLILYTSGTSGRPKGTVSSHQALLTTLQNSRFAGAYSAAEAVRLSGAAPVSPAREPVALITSPLFHISGLHWLMLGMYSGARLVIPKGRFDPVEVLELIEREQVTAWTTVPTVVRRVCEQARAERYNTSSVSSVTYGGSPSGPDLQAMVRATFPGVGGGANVYGLTETNGTATFQTPAEAAARPHSVGRLLPPTQLRIVGDEGSGLPAGEDGEILLRTPAMCLGYWNRPEETAQVFVDGWFATGDVGHLDQDGYLYVVDRKKDMIIRGGENIACAEVEECLVRHSEVLDVAVIGVPDPDLGEIVKAIIQARVPVSVTADDVRAWAGASLAQFKVPALVEIRTTNLPRNASGKLIKGELKREAQNSAPPLHGGAPGVTTGVPVPLQKWLVEAEQWLAGRLPRSAAKEQTWGVGSDDVSIFAVATAEQERQRMSELREWQRVKYDAGYGAVAWSPRYGGAGLTPRHDAAFRGVEIQFDAPHNHELMTVSTGLIAPTIAQWGTEAQRTRWIPALLRADEMCCQLFSEPEAGSDLAGLRTTARRDGDEWVVRGQKVWTSGAGFAEWGLAICRVAGHPSAKVALMVPLRAEGVEIRPIVQMNGSASFNEVRLDDVRVPDTHRIGGEDDGWKVALTVLRHERKAAGTIGGATGATWRDVVALARWLGVDGDPIVRQDLARLYSQHQVLKWTTKRAATRTESAVALGSMTKLLWTERLRAVGEVAAGLLGARVTADTGEWGTFAWTQHILGAPGMRIAGGTDEIQRNLIAELLLGLPKEARTLRPADSAAGAEDGRTPDRA